MWLTNALPIATRETEIMAMRDRPQERCCSLGFIRATVSSRCPFAQIRPNNIRRSPRATSASKSALSPLRHDYNSGITPFAYKVSTTV